MLLKGRNPPPMARAVCGNTEQSGRGDAERRTCHLKANAPLSRGGWSTGSRRARQTHCMLKKGRHEGTFSVTVRSNNASKTSGAAGASAPSCGVSRASLAGISIVKHPRLQSNTWAPGALIPGWRKRSSGSLLVMLRPEDGRHGREERGECRYQSGQGRLAQWMNNSYAGSGVFSSKGNTAEQFMKYYWRNGYYWRNVQLFVMIDCKRNRM